MKGKVWRSPMDWPGGRPWFAMNRNGWTTAHETWVQAMEAAGLPAWLRAVR